MTEANFDATRSQRKKQKGVALSCNAFFRNGFRLIPVIRWYRRPIAGSHIDIDLNSLTRIVRRTGRVFTVVIAVANIVAANFIARLRDHVTTLHVAGHWYALDLGIII